MNHPNQRRASVRQIRNATVVLGTALVMALAACRPSDNDAPPAATPAPAAPAATSPAVEPAPASAATVLQSQWQCGDERVSARFDQAAENVTLVHGAGELVLPLAMSASGARYADDKGNEFWTKGPGGTLTLSGTPARECTEIGSPGG